MLPVVLQLVTSRIPWLFAGQQGRVGPVMYLSGPQTAMSRKHQAITALFTTLFTALRRPVKQYAVYAAKQQVVGVVAISMHDTEPCMQF